MINKAMAEPRNFTVAEDDDGIRLDRWFKRHQPDISFNIVSRWARTGQLRLDGKRAVPGDRIEAGQQIQFPPAEAEPERSGRPARKIDPLTAEEEALVREMVIFRNANAFVLNKPPGLATQGGTKTHQHLDRLLDGLADDDGNRPKLVIASTRIRRAHCSSHARRGPPAISPRPLPAEPRGKSIGR